MRRAVLVFGFLLLVPLGTCGAEPAIGRLFFTSAQRAALEHARQKNIRSTLLASRSASKANAAAARDVVINGLLLRDDGKWVIWVNGKAIESQTADGLRVSPTASRESVLLHEADSQRTLQVKVGQHADLVSGRVEESYQAHRAAARAHAAAPEPAPDRIHPRTRRKTSELLDSRSGAIDELRSESAPAQPGAKSESAGATLPNDASHPEAQ